MAPLCLSAATAPSVTHVRAACVPTRTSVRFAAPVRPRMVVMRNVPSEEGIKSEEDPYEIPQTGRMAPMSENKRADTPEQGAAPEGDKAIEGQKWQPTKQDGETPEDRYGSAEAAQEAMEAHKDKSKKSELQTGDMDGNYANGSA